MGLFIFTLQENPLNYLAVVFAVVVSVVLHELAHGWMAIRLGDPTPRLSGHMTLSPLVHMGPISLVMLLVAGIAFGQMPVDPTRLRGKYAESLVSAAGPVTNLLLAAVSLTALGLWMRWDTQWTAFEDNLGLVVWVFGMMNLVLTVFNLLPAPPLDGSGILANFHRGYAELINGPQRQGVSILLLVLAFGASGWIMQYTARWAMQYARWIETVGRSPSAYDLLGG